MVLLLKEFSEAENESLHVTKMPSFEKWSRQKCHLLKSGVDKGFSFRLRLVNTGFPFLLFNENHLFNLTTFDFSYQLLPEPIFGFKKKMVFWGKIPFFSTD